MGDALSMVPGILADVFGQGALQWRAAIGTGTWADLVDARLTNQRETLQYDEKHDRERKRIEADLTVPASSDELQIGSEVLDPDGSTTWAVEDKSGDPATGLRKYVVRRDPTVKHAADRGRLS